LGERNYEKELVELDTYGVGIFVRRAVDKFEIPNKYEVVSVFIYSKLDKKSFGSIT
jgi:hypothetical protein